MLIIKQWSLWSDVKSEKKVLHLSWSCDGHQWSCVHCQWYEHNRGSPKNTGPIRHVSVHSLQQHFAWATAASSHSHSLVFVALLWQGSYWTWISSNRLHWQTFKVSHLYPPASDLLTRCTLALFSVRQSIWQQQGKTIAASLPSVPNIIPLMLSVTSIWG